MLVLARKKNESIVINDDIEIYVVDINHDQVKLGIRAPKHVKIHRKEIFDSIKEEMKNAAGSDVDNLKKLPDFENLKKNQDNQQK